MAKHSSRDFSKYTPSWAQQAESDVQSLAQPQDVINRIETESGQPMSAEEKQQLVTDMTSKTGMNFDTAVGKRSGDSATMNGRDFSKYRPSWVDSLPDPQAKDAATAAPSAAPVIPTKAEPKDTTILQDLERKGAEITDTFSNFFPKIAVQSKKAEAAKIIRAAEFGGYDTVDGDGQHTFIPVTEADKKQAQKDLLVASAQGAGIEKKSEEFLGGYPLSNEAKAYQEGRKKTGFTETLANMSAHKGAAASALLTSVIDFAPTILAGVVDPVLGVAVGASQMAGGAYGDSSARFLASKGIDPSDTKKVEEFYSDQKNVDDANNFTALHTAQMAAVGLALPAIGKVTDMALPAFDSVAGEVVAKTAAHTVTAGATFVGADAAVNAATGDKTTGQSVIDNALSGLPFVAKDAAGFHEAAVRTREHQAAQAADLTKTGLETFNKKVQDNVTKPDDKLNLDIKAEQDRINTETAKADAFKQAERERQGAETQQQKDQQEADYRNNELERQYAGQTRLDKYPDGSMERVPVNPPAGHTAESVKAEREQAQADEAARLERVALGTDTEHLRKRQQVAADAATNAQAKAEKAAATADGRIRRTVADKLVEENPGVDPAELVTQYRERVAQAKIDESIPKTKKGILRASERAKVTAAADALKVKPDAPVAPPVAPESASPKVETPAKPDAELTPDEVKQLYRDSGMPMGADATLDMAGKAKHPTEEFPTRLHKLFKGLVKHGSKESRGIQELVKSRKLIIAPNAESIGRKGEGAAAQYDTKEGRMYMYTDHMDVDNPVSAIIRAAHESTHDGQFYAREGRSSILRDIMGQELNTRAKNLVYSLDGKNAIATEAIRKARLEAQKKGKPELENLELMAHFVGEAAKSRQGFGRLGGVLHDIRSAGRNYLRSHGLDLDVSLSDLVSASRDVIGESAKTDSTPEKSNTLSLKTSPSNLNMVGSGGGKGFKEAKAEGRTWMGPDGKERYEIDDSGAEVVMTDTAKADLLAGKKVPISDIWSHPELDSNYPNKLDNLQVRVDPTLPKHEAMYTGGHVAISKSLLGDHRALNEILAHEVGHNIQAEEGLIRGTAPEAFLVKETSKARRAVDYATRDLEVAEARFPLGIATTLLPERIQKTYDARIARMTSRADKVNEFVVNGFADNVAPTGPGMGRHVDMVKAEADKYKKAIDAKQEATQVLQDLNKKAADMYYKHYGEAEQFNVMRRMGMSDESRKAAPFESTLTDGKNGKPTDMSKYMGRDGAPLPDAAAKADKTDSLDMAADEEVIKTPAFKRWFGGSKVVDDSGKPRVMFHGTRATTNFDAFQNNPLKDLGMHFGTKGQANHSRFVDGDPHAFNNKILDKFPIPPSRIIPVFLSIKNPLRMPDVFGGLGESAITALEGTKVIPKATIDALKEHTRMYGPDGEIVNYGDREALVSGIQKAIEDAGYDGIVYENIGEPSYVEYGLDDYGKENPYDIRDVVHDDSYIVFHPEQIKSATGNNGNFDAKDPSILNMAEETAEPIKDRKSSPRLVGESEKQWDDRIAQENVGPLRRAFDFLFGVDPVKEHGRQTIVGTLASRDRQYTIAERSLHQYKVHFDKMPEERRLELIDAMENGTEITDPNAKAMFDAIAPIFKQSLDYIREQDPSILKNLREFYVPHIWKKPSKASSFFQSKGPLAGPKSFAKARRWPTMKEAMESGLEPVTTNPAELTMLKLGELLKYAGLLHMKETMNARGWVVKHNAAGNESMPAGWSSVRDPSFNGYVIPTPLAKDLNGYLSRGMSDIPGFKKVRYLENLMVAGKLGWSGFHAGFTTMDNVITHSEVAGRRLLMGDTKGGLLGMLHAFSSPLLSPYEGGALNKTFLGEAPKSAAQAKRWKMAAGIDEHTKALLDLVEKGGGRAYMDSSEWNAGLPKITQAIRQNDALGMAKYAIPAIADVSGWLIHRKLVPAQKAAARILMLKFELDRFAKDLGVEKGDYNGIIEAMHPDAAAQISRKVVNLIDDRLGHMAYDNQFWNPYAKHMAQLIVMAPGWVSGTFRTITGGVADIGRIVDPERIIGPLDKAGNITDAKFGRITSRTANLAMLSMFTAAASGVFMYALTGQWPQEGKDYVHPKTGRKNSDGTDERISWPTYAKEHYALLTHPVKEITGKLNQPLIADAWALMHNADFTNTEIFDSRAPLSQQAKQVALFIAKGFAEPISASNNAKADKMDTLNPNTPGKNDALRAVAMFGMTPAPTAIDHSATENFINDKYFASFPKQTLSRDQKDSFAAKGDAAAQLRNGGSPDLSGFTDKERKSILGNANIEVYAKRFKGIRNIEDRMEAWDLATPAEREKYNMKEALLKNARTQIPAITNPERRADIQKRINEIRNQ